MNLPRKPRGQQIFLTHAEVTLVLLLAYTGLRWGEATELRVGDLDLLRKRITVTRNAVRSGGAVEVGTPTSGRGRTVPIRGPACRDVDAVAGRLDHAATESVGVSWVKTPKPGSR